MSLLYACEYMTTLMERSRLVRQVVEGLHGGARDYEVSVPLEQLRQAQETRAVFQRHHHGYRRDIFVGGWYRHHEYHVGQRDRAYREIGIRRAVGHQRSSSCDNSYLSQC